jgi:hypothetical protein
MDDSIRLSIWNENDSNPIHSEIFVAFQIDCWGECNALTVDEVNEKLKYFNGRLDRQINYIIFNSEADKLEFLLTYR